TWGALDRQGDRLDPSPWSEQWASQYLAARLAWLRWNADRTVQPGWHDFRRRAAVEPRRLSAHASGVGRYRSDARGGCRNVRSTMVADILACHAAIGAAEHPRGSATVVHTRPGIV